MSSTVLSTQRNSTAFLSAPKKVDPFNPDVPASISNRGVIKKSVISASRDASFGSFANSQVVEFLLPNEEGQHLIDVAVKFSLGALSSGNYCAYPAISIPTRVQLLDGTEVIMDYDYRRVMLYVLKNRTDIERASILANAGGTSFASGDCKAPIPLFFSKWIAKFGQQMPFFASHKLKNQLKLRITLDIDDNVAASGATVGTPTISGELHILSAFKAASDSDPDSQWNTYQSYDFEVDENNTVATATATEIDVGSFTGNLVELLVCNQLATDLSTAHDYFKCKPVTASLLKIGNDQWYETTSAVDFDYDSVALGYSSGNNSTLGNPLSIPFGVQEDPRTFTGALNMDDIKKLIVKITHAQGADTKVSLMGVKNAYYTIEAGRMHKKLE